MSQITKRVTFSFDDANYHKLYALQEKLGAKSMGEVVKTAVYLLDVIHEEQRKGFTEIALRDPKRPKHERIVTVDLLGES